MNNVQHFLCENEFEAKNKWNGMAKENNWILHWTLKFKKENDLNAIFTHFFFESEGLTAGLLAAEGFAAGVLVAGVLVAGVLAFFDPLASCKRSTYWKIKTYQHL